MKKKKITLALIMLFIITTCVSIPFNPVKAGPSTVYGYVEDGNGDGIEDVVVEAYISGFKEGEDTTDSSGYYDINLGPLGGNTVVILKLYPDKDFKDKITSTVVTSDEDKQKDVTLNQFFAVIVDGNGGVHANDAELLYSKLYQNYSYSHTNLLFLSCSSEVSNRDWLASEYNFGQAVDQIVDDCTFYDEVSFWFIGHGYTNYFVLNEDELNGTELDTELDQITCNSMYIFLGQCFSGSMIDDINDTSNRAIYTATAYDEPGNADENHTFWIYGNIKGIEINAEDADDNSDLQVSLYELYDYAYDYVRVTRGCTDQTPQRWVGSSINPDTNDYLGDNSYL